MKQKPCQFTLRTTREALNKLEYIAGYYGRTKNKELVLLLERYIQAYEKKYGEIEL